MVAQYRESQTKSHHDQPQSPRRKYRHTAYWHAKHAGKRRIDFSLAAEYIRELRKPYRRHGRAIYEGVPVGTGFNPLVFGLFIAVDIGIAIENSVRKILDPEERARMKRELMRDLRIARRPFYYAQERARRRQLAAERRKVTRRTTLAPCPAPDEVLAAWRVRKESKANMILLGGMLQDLECYVDNSLRFDEGGNVVGRNGGIRGWLAENLPELLGHYKTLMRYKAMAIRLRQVTGTRDPVPTAALLGENAGAPDSAANAGFPEQGIHVKTPMEERCARGERPARIGPGTPGRIATGRDDTSRRGGKPAEGGLPMPRTAETRHEVVEAILADPRPTFASILEHLARRLDPEAVLADAPTGMRSGEAAGMGAGKAVRTAKKAVKRN